jgi:hypothetical protein
MEVKAAVRHLLHCFGEQRRIVVLGDVTLRPGLYRAHGYDWVVVHAEDDEPGLRRSLDDPSQQLQSRMSRQIDVDHRDVGSQVEKSGEAGRAVLRFEGLDGRIHPQKAPGIPI